MPSELAFLFHNVVPQGLHPGSGDYTFKKSCNIIFLSLNSQFKHKSGGVTFYHSLLSTLSVLIFVYETM